MGQEESTGTPSDLSDTSKFYSENPGQYESSNMDIYSRQNCSYQIMLDNYIKKSKPSESDQLFADNFYVEIFRNYNHKIHEKSINDNENNNNNNDFQIELKDQVQSQLSKYEIEKINHETDEIYNHTLPALNADISNLKNLIEMKQQPKNIEPQHIYNGQTFNPDCSMLNP